MSVMTDKELTVLEWYEDRIVVGSDMLSFSMDYPETFTHDGVTYNWDGKIPMDDKYVGHFFSTAEYRI